MDSTSSRTLLNGPGGAALLLAALASWVSMPLAGPPGLDGELRRGRVQERPARLLPLPATDQDFTTASPAKVALGRALFFDKILSGNRDVSCGTCHHPLAHTADGLSLSLGMAADGLSVTRVPGALPGGVGERVPRNAPAIFNLGAREFTRMFHDGRVEVDPDQPSGFRSPAGADLPPGLDSPLAVQAMFPPTSGTEMAGRPGENDVADAAAAGDLAGPDGVWEQLSRRLRAIPEYVGMFRAAFSDVSEPEDIRFVHVANAIAAFEAVTWRADDSPFDRYLRGEHQAMSLSARRGMRLFYGEAGCGDCHAGTFQTDHEFHAIAMPQIGPGKGDGFDGHEDFGHERVSGDPGDRYRFRTPSLRNVALTAPYGHDGAYAELEAVVRHHLDAVAALEGYDPTQAVLPSRPDLDAVDLVVHGDPVRRAAIAAASELPPVALSEDQLRRLLDFLHALTDPSSIDLKRDVPSRVPSGLPVAD